MARIKILVDLEHSAQLLRGKAIAFRVPKSADEIEIQLSKVQRNFKAEILDVFFNGRPAK